MELLFEASVLRYWNLCHNMGIMQQLKYSVFQIGLLNMDLKKNCTSNATMMLNPL